MFFPFSSNGTPPEEAKSEGRLIKHYLSFISSYFRPRVILGNEILWDIQFPMCLLNGKYLAREPCRTDRAQRDEQDQKPLNIFSIRPDITQSISILSYMTYFLHKDVNEQDRTSFSGPLTSTRQAPTGDFSFPKVLESAQAEPYGSYVRLYFQEILWGSFSSISHIASSQVFLVKKEMILKRMTRVGKGQTFMTTCISQVSLSFRQTFRVLLELW